MKKFQKIFENNLKTTELRRIKIKIDPKYAAREEYTGLEGYIGYILAEDQENVTVYIEECGDIQIIPVSCIQAEKDPKLAMFTAIVLEYLQQNKGVDSEDPLCAQLINATSIDNIELFLKEKGCTSDDLLNIYKGLYNAI